jgi:uncharacterized repeat protein (TIGR03803 family)
MRRLLILLILVGLVGPTAFAQGTWKEEVLYSFTGGTDGKHPYAGLIGDAAGNLYGVGHEGGAYGHGTVFKLDTTGKLTVLHAFAGQPSDGDTPFGVVLRDAAGNLYGTTVYGGAYNHGTVYKLDPTGKFTLLYSFAGAPSDGANPFTDLHRDAAGNLYGTTYYGGDGACNDSGGVGCGTVFKVNPRSHQETVLHSFAGHPTDGAHFHAGVMLEAAGNLYCVSIQGGAYDSGTVFKIGAVSGQETVLHSFAGQPSDGAHPHATLISDTAGNLYGTTMNGGAYDHGSVFKLDTTGTLTLLHSFAGQPSDGSTPHGILVRDGAGNLYGTTELGGSDDQGTVFKLDTTGTLTLLYSFTGQPDGYEPIGGLVQYAGSLYSTSHRGGSDNLGTVFKLTPP